MACIIKEKKALLHPLLPFSRSAVQKCSIISTTQWHVMMQFSKTARKHVLKGHIIHGSAHIVFHYIVTRIMGLRVRVSIGVTYIRVTICALQCCNTTKQQEQFYQGL